MDTLERLQDMGRQTASEKDSIVSRLLASGHVTPAEAVILLKTIDIQISAETLEVSSGAKILGGSDFSIDRR